MNLDGEDEKIWSNNTIKCVLNSKIHKKWNRVLAFKAP